MEGSRQSPPFATMTSDLFSKLSSQSQTQSLRDDMVQIRANGKSATDGEDDESSGIRKREGSREALKAAVGKSKKEKGDVVARSESRGDRKEGSAGTSELGRGWEAEESSEKGTQVSWKPAEREVLESRMGLRFSQKKFLKLVNEILEEHLELISASDDESQIKSEAINGSIEAPVCAMNWEGEHKAQAGVTTSRKDVPEKDLSAGLLAPNRKRESERSSGSANGLRQRKVPVASDQVEEWDIREAWTVSWDGEMYDAEGNLVPRSNEEESAFTESQRKLVVDSPEEQDRKVELIMKEEEEEKKRTQRSGEAATKRLRDKLTKVAEELRTKQENGSREKGKIRIENSERELVYEGSLEGWLAMQEREERLNRSDSSESDQSAEACHSAHENMGNPTSHSRCADDEDLPLVDDDLSEMGNSSDELEMLDMSDLRMQSLLGLPSGRSTRQPQPRPSVVAISEAAAKANELRAPSLRRPRLNQCEKCDRAFLSPLNLRRHMRMHNKQLNSEKGREDLAGERSKLASFIAKLEPKALLELLSLDDAKIEGLSGPEASVNLAMLLLQLNSEVYPNIQYTTGTGAAYQNRLMAARGLLLMVEGKFPEHPVPVEDLFLVLDLGSESTFLHGGTATAVQRYIFQAQAARVGLEQQNVVATVAFLLEHKLVQAWMANKDAEALRLQQALVEEEEAAQQRRAKLVEKKRQKKQRQRGGKAGKERKGGGLSSKGKASDQAAESGQLAGQGAFPSESSEESEQVEAVTAIERESEREGASVDAMPALERSQKGELRNGIQGDEALVIVVEPRTPPLPEERLGGQSRPREDFEMDGADVSERPGSVEESREALAENSAGEDGSRGGDREAQTRKAGSQGVERGLGQEANGSGEKWLPAEMGGPANGNGTIREGQGSDSSSMVLPGATETGGASQGRDSRGAGQEPVLLAETREKEPDGGGTGGVGGYGPDKAAGLNGQPGTAGSGSKQKFPELPNDTPQHAGRGKGLNRQASQKWAKVQPKKEGPLGAVGQVSRSEAEVGPREGTSRVREEGTQAEIRPLPDATGREPGGWAAGLVPGVAGHPVGLNGKMSDKKTVQARPGYENGRNMSGNHMKAVTAVTAAAPAAAPRMNGRNGEEPAASALGELAALAVYVLEEERRVTGASDEQSVEMRQQAATSQALAGSPPMAQLHSVRNVTGVPSVPAPGPPPSSTASSPGSEASPVSSVGDEVPTVLMVGSLTVPLVVAPPNATWQPGAAAPAGRQAHQTAPLGGPPPSPAVLPMHPTAVVGLNWPAQQSSADHHSGFVKQNGERAVYEQAVHVGGRISGPPEWCQAGVDPPTGTWVALRPPAGPRGEDQDGQTRGTGMDSAGGTAPGQGLGFGPMSSGVQGSTFERGRPMGPATASSGPQSSRQSWGGRKSAQVWRPVAVQGGVSADSLLFGGRGAAGGAPMDNGLATKQTNGRQAQEGTAAGSHSQELQGRAGEAAAVKRSQEQVEKRLEREGGAGQAVPRRMAESSGAVSALVASCEDFLAKRWAAALASPDTVIYDASCEEAPPCDSQPFLVRTQQNLEEAQASTQGPSQEGREGETDPPTGEARPLLRGRDETAEDSQLAPMSCRAGGDGQVAPPDWQRARPVREGHRRLGGGGRSEANAGEGNAETANAERESRKVWVERVVRQESSAEEEEPANSIARLGDARSEAGPAWRDSSQTGLPVSGDAPVEIPSVDKKGGFQGGDAEEGKWGPGYKEAAEAGTREAAQSERSEGMRSGRTGPNGRRRDMRRGHK